MKAELLTKQAGRDLKYQVVDWCGSMAGTAVDEVFEDAWFHGKNQICQIVDENDHLVVVLDSECPDRVDHGAPARDSVITDLCQQGIVLYYYHSIHERRHHVCLALKKKNGDYRRL